MNKGILIKNFKMIRPEYEINQKDYSKINLEILYQSFLKKNNYIECLDTKRKIQEDIENFMCKPDRLYKRAFFCPDLHEVNPENRRISNTLKNEFGSNLAERMEVFKEISLNVFEKTYTKETTYPDILVFTTSVGYIAPSPAQIFLSQKGWYNTNVYHVFHSGCYGAFPAINIASSQVAYRNQCYSSNEKADIIHIESNFLHYNPSKRNAAQLINHSLFSDGAIKYSVELENANNSANSLKLINSFDKIIPNTQNAVDFRINDISFFNEMSKNLAELVIDNITEYLYEFCFKAKINFDFLCENALFALHPGGPKILDGIVEKLKLKPWQVENSYYIFENFGNMSSATLPHVLQRICENDNYVGKYVLALGMSPGLTIGCALLKRL